VVAELNLNEARARLQKNSRVTHGRWEKNPAPRTDGAAYRRREMVGDSPVAVHDSSERREGRLRLVHDRER
jgi:hypothetical protein